MLCFGCMWKHGISFWNLWLLFTLANVEKIIGAGLRCSQLAFLKPKFTAKIRRDWVAGPKIPDLDRIQSAYQLIPLLWDIRFQLGTFQVQMINRIGAPFAAMTLRSQTVAIQPIGRRDCLIIITATQCTGPRSAH